MKPLQHKKHTLAKRGLSLLCVLAFCLGLLPVTALAADGIELYVGGQQIKESGCYENKSGTWTKVDGTEPANGQFSYDADSVTLTLNEAEIVNYQDVTVGGGFTYPGSVIAFSQSADVSLKIVVSQGTSNITGTGGIRVVSKAGDASLSISGPGSLEVNVDKNDSGISLIGSKNVNLNIDGADVKTLAAYYYGVDLHAGDGFKAAAVVNNGKLTAGGSGGIGIYYRWTNPSDSGTSSLTVSGNAVVDTRDSKILIASQASEVQVSAGSDGNGGIVFDGKSGTVYGDVTLQEDLEIGTDETLTIGKDASLTVPEEVKLTNNGKIDNSGELNGTVDGSGTVTPKITTDSLPDGTVNQLYTATLQATGNGITWSSSGMPEWMTLDSSTGVISGNPTTADTYTFTVTATNDSGSDSKEFTLTINPAPILVTGVTLDQAELALYTGGSATLSATVTPENATNTSLTWASDAENIATVDQSGNVKAVGAGTATITATAADGSGCSATCTVTVTDKTYTISADPTALNFGSAYTGYAQPAAQTVTLTNTGNQPVTLTQPASTNSFEVGILSQTALAAGDTATFTVQPKAGLSAGTYSDTITVSGTNNATSSIIASFTVKSQPPTVSEKTIDAIQDAEPGETVTVDLSHGSTKLDKEVFETLAGQDITLDIDLGDGLSWTVNGSDIPEDADFTDIDMGVTMNSDGIPVDVVNAITGEHGSVQLELAHDGAFGFTMTLAAPLGEENAGYWANLYYFNESTNKMTFETAAKINSDGTASLSFSHASQYAIVIDDHNHGVVELPFTDVSEGDWFYDPVCFVYSQGLMTGTSATTFEPNTHLTRAMLVAVLHRLEGSPQASVCDFSDVADGDWYAQAVNWAASVGVVNGFDDGTFQPNAAITREQMAAILRNYAAYKGLDVSASGSLSTFTDAASVSDWAKESVEWAVGSGLLGDYEDSTLRPQGTTTRAEVASVLQRALGNVAGNQ